MDEECADIYVERGGLSSMEDTERFRQMLVERGIPVEWANRATEFPDRTEDKEDGTRHSIKQIPESGGRWLRVIVNVAISPSRRITVFLEPRLSR